MRLDGDSWLITTEVTLASLKGAAAPKPLVGVQVLSTPLGSNAADGTPRPVLYTDRDLLLGGDSIGLRHLGKGWTSAADAERGLTLCVRELSRRSAAEVDYAWHREIAEDVFAKVPVPVFGSPPREWQPLATLVSGGGASVATAVAAIEGSHTPATFIVSFATMTVLVNVLVPATAAFGRGVAHRIDRFMGTPPGPPAAASSGPPTPVPPE